jgi:hypothetical protein
MFPYPSTNPYAYAGPFGLNAIAYTTIQPNGDFGEWHILKTNVIYFSTGNLIHTLAVTGNTKDDFLYFIGSRYTGISRIPLSALNLDWK